MVSDNTTFLSAQRYTIPGDNAVGNNQDSCDLISFLFGRPVRPTIRTANVGQIRTIIVRAREEELNSFELSKYWRKWSTRIDVTPLS